MKKLFKSYQAKYVSKLVGKEKMLNVNKCDSSILNSYLNRKNINYDILSFLNKDDPIFNSFEDIHPASLRRITHICDLNYIDKKGMPLSYFYIHDNHCKSDDFMNRLNCVNHLSMINIKQLVDDVFNRGYFINGYKLEELLKINKVNLNEYFTVNNKKYNFAQYILFKFENFNDLAFDNFHIIFNMINFIMNHSPFLIDNEIYEKIILTLSNIEKINKKEILNHQNINCSQLVIKLEQICLSNLVLIEKKSKKTGYKI
jgi:hypothetical protein